MLETIGLQDIVMLYKSGLIKKEEARKALKAKEIIEDVAFEE